MTEVEQLESAEYFNEEPWPQKCPAGPGNIFSIAA